MGKSKLECLKASCFFNVLLLILFADGLLAQNPINKKNGLQIQFEHFVGNEILRLDSSMFKNELAQEYYVTKFKYYIGAINLVEESGLIHKNENYFLINEEDLSSKSILLNNIPEGKYISLRFTVGVDSIDNCSGAQSGALDPMNAMFWTWNTGYIFMKLEGRADVSIGPNAMFEFHIGGFRGPNNALKTISLPFKSSIYLSPEKEEIITIKTDVSEIFKTPTTIDFSKISSVTDINNARMIADNYENMFSILKCSNEE